MSMKEVWDRLTGNVHHLNYRKKDRLIKAEQEAKKRKKGMWSQSKIESPMEYKKRTKG